MEEYSLESVREAISNILDGIPPEQRTPEINKMLEQLYKIEKRLLLNDLRYKV